jgi:hypothetical protein
MIALAAPTGYTGISLAITSLRRQAINRVSRSAIRVDP